MLLRLGFSDFDHALQNAAPTTGILNPVARGLPAPMGVGMQLRRNRANRDHARQNATPTTQTSLRGGSVEGATPTLGLNEVL
jgi:hypothetical protein